MRANQMRLMIEAGVVAGCVGACGAVQAQAVAPLGTSHATPMHEHTAQLLAQHLSGDMLDLAGMQLGSERVVKGAPYCADAVQENVQWLSDGAGGSNNRIVRRQTTRLCRDGEGRTRQEVEQGGRKLVYLRDPVSRESWVLDAERKTARPLNPMSMLGMPDSGEWHAYAERMRDWAKNFASAAQASARAASGAGRTASPTAPPAMPTPPTLPAPPQPPLPLQAGAQPPTAVLVTPATRAASAAGEEGGRQRQVRIIKMGDDGDLASLPPEVSWRAHQFAPRGAGVLSPLGGKDIEGLRANGERTSWTIAAGKVGNEKPIVITREVWSSPDLMLTLSSRDFDPRSGESSYRLSNLKRGEPDAALMRVPADFNTVRRTPATPGRMERG